MFRNLIIILLLIICVSCDKRTDTKFYDESTGSVYVGNVLLKDGKESIVDECLRNGFTLMSDKVRYELIGLTETALVAYDASEELIHKFTYGWFRDLPVLERAMLRKAALVVYMDSYSDEISYISISLKDVNTGRTYDTTTEESDLIKKRIKQIYPSYKEADGSDELYDRSDENGITISAGYDSSITIMMDRE